MLRELSVDEIRGTQLGNQLAALLDSVEQELSKAEVPEGYGKHRVIQLCEYIDEGRARFAIYVEGGTLAGYIWFFDINENTIHINEFGVDKAYRHKGIGSRLLAYVDEEAKRANKTTVELRVAMDNETAKRLYLSKGYVPEELFMRKGLDAAPDEKDAMPDVYFCEAYGKLCEAIDGGTSTVFDYKSDLGHVRAMFIKRPVAVNGLAGEYFDITTPYGYGGPIILSCQDGNKEALVAEYGRAFQQFCKDNRIIAEFIRWHPILGNADDFRTLYDVRYMRHTVGTDLSVDDPYQSQFNKKCRYSVRKAAKEGVCARVIEDVDEESMRRFIECYYDSMRHNDADDYYYFSQEYFEACLSLLRDHMVIVEALYEDVVICSELYFTWGPYLHSHLSGTLNDYRQLSPDYAVMQAAAEWGKQNGFAVLHTGGGTSNDEDDPLYRYKKKFGKLEYDFCISKKIWDEAAYDKACKQAGISDVERVSPADVTEGAPVTSFFPAYRFQGH